MNDVAKAILLGFIGGAAAELGHYLAGGVIRRSRPRRQGNRLEQLEQLLRQLDDDLAAARAELELLTTRPPAP